MKTKTSGRFDPAQVAKTRSRFSHPGEYTPDQLGSIISAANSGYIEDLCIAGREIMERNWDIIAALEQRADALAGSSWSVIPGDDSPVAKEAAERFEAELKKAGTRVPTSPLGDSDASSGWRSAVVDLIHVIQFSIY